VIRRSKVKPSLVILENVEPKRFMQFRRSQDEIKDYNSGFAASLEVAQPHEGESVAWQSSWDEAQE
jgi:hypothetical protein